MAMPYIPSGLNTLIARGFEKSPKGGKSPNLVTLYQLLKSDWPRILSRRLAIG